MRNPDVGCRRDQKGMRRGMDAPLKRQQKMEKGDEHPPLIPLSRGWTHSVYVQTVVAAVLYQNAANCNVVVS